MNWRVWLMLACAVFNVVTAFIPGNPYYTALDAGVAAWCFYMAWRFYRPPRDREYAAMVRDSMMYGTGAMRGGKRIPHEEIYRSQSEFK